MVLSSNPAIMTATTPQLRTTVQEFVENDHPDVVPDEYIIPIEERCELTEININKLSTSSTEESTAAIVAPLDIPLIDMEGVVSSEESGGERRCVVLQQIRDACQEWGFFQVKNHGVPSPLIKRMQRVAQEFLALPSEEKHQMRLKAVQGWIVDEGYSSKRATSEGGISHWSDRLRHCMFPISSRKYDLWPTNPPSFRFVKFDTTQILESVCSVRKSQHIKW